MNGYQTLSVQMIARQVIFIHIILTKYKALHQTDVSENNPSLGMLTILMKVQTVSITSNIFAGKFTHILSERTK